MSRSRAAFIAFAALAACTFAAAAARAQTPSTAPTIRFIITHPAGGLPDTVARIVGRRLQERLNQTVVVENRSGANGGIAVNVMLNAPADGTTFIVTDGAILSINPQLYPKLSYNPKDVVPIAGLATAPLFLAVHPSVPATTMKDFIAHVKDNPGKYNIGSSGVGSIHHISLEALKSGFGLQISHVPYKGTGEAVPALLGGHVQMLFSAYPSLAGAADTKRITLLATNGATRSSQAPNLPAIAEFVPGFSYAPIVGIYARAGMPDTIIRKISAEAMAIVKEPEVIKQLEKVGVEPQGGNASDFRKLLDGEIERVAKVVKAAGIKVE
jgi:tripartite-type tricarboxylate transporter receptor subunit TctC